MKRITTLLLLLMLSQIGWSQAYPDRHNTTLDNSWLSCNATQSPNSNRGISHWIMYDLGTTYALNKTTFWNVNAYQHSDEGSNDIKIDYSLDGINWFEFGRYTLNQAPEISTYQGEAGPDLNGLVAKYILITSETNHGGTCHGLSEFRVESTPVTISDVSDLALDIDVVAQPNPFNLQSTIVLSDLPEGNMNYQLIDMSGKVVRQLAIQNKEFILDGSGLAAGIYTLKIIHKQGVKSIQINHIN